MPDPPILALHPRPRHPQPHLRRQPVRQPRLPAQHHTHRPLDELVPRHLNDGARTNC
ncbi:hypothetical protein [Kitasatospora sp. NPDC097691]|uniref:hypothetical protein n=1 Tax=Kitasatospora sp. NPDC097691 TaxID=3157231 RepID=UPI003333EE49